jgi:PAS domain S-box-containing protein
MGPQASANLDVMTEPTTSDMLAAVVEMSDDAIFSFDSAGRVATWCPTAERLFGCSAHQVLDRTLDVLFPQHLAAEVQAVVVTVLAGNRIKHFETEVVRPDGMPLPVSLSLCPILDEHKTTIGSVVIARDVTEQRLAQATLAEVDARMQAGEAMAHIGSWMWDVRTGAVQWSKEFHRIHGVDLLDFDGTFEGYLALIHPEDRPDVRNSMTASIQSGHPYQDEYRVERPAGEVRYVQVRAQPSFGSDGTGVGLRGIGRAISPPSGVADDMTPDDPLNQSRPDSS